MSRKKWLTAVASSMAEVSATAEVLHPVVKRAEVFHPVVKKVQSTVYKPAQDPSVKALKQELKDLRKAR